MHVGGTKTRMFAVAMALLASLQFWPNAFGDSRARVAAKAVPRTLKTETAEAKGHKKGQKKSDEKQDTDEIVATAVKATKPLATPKPDPVKVALKVAKAQLGKPYRWAADGPSSFDCSGLTMYVYSKVGINLPHNSSAQRAATKYVPLSKMKPGDLIFSPGHVGLYIGDGKMIHAPRSGRNVEIAPIHSRARSAGRPIA